MEGLPDLADLPDLVIPDVDKTALSTRGTQCLSRPGAHTPHAMNWWMCGGTCPVYLNWSAPHMSSHTNWNSGHELWTKLSRNSLNESIIPWTIFFKYCYLITTELPISRECSKFQGCWKHLTTSRPYTFFNRLYRELCHFRCRVNIRYHQIWKVCQIWETFHIWCWASTWLTLKCSK